MIQQHDGTTRNMLHDKAKRNLFHFNLSYRVLVPYHRNLAITQQRRSILQWNVIASMI